MEMAKMNNKLFFSIAISFIIIQPVFAQQETIQTQTSFTEKQEKYLSDSTIDSLNNFDPLTYKLGPEDVVEITVMNHPEFSGKYAINLDGILQYKFVGDIKVNDLTKKELENKLKSIISTYVINPSINVTVIEYKSKVIYVLGEVKQPGKYYMRSESIPIREAVVQAGLPLQSAAMRKCRIITPDKNGRVKTRSVDLYAVLYGGNLKLNLEMHPGDVLYVPCTVMAKLFRVISPVTSTVSGAAAGPEGAASAKTSAATLAR
jgi:polysaccharide export outer membrane protein